MHIVPVPSQIHAALSCYFEYPREIEEEILHGYEKTEALRAAATDMPLQKRLRELRHGQDSAKYLNE